MSNRDGLRSTLDRHNSHQPTTTTQIITAYITLRHTYEVQDAMDANEPPPGLPDALAGPAWGDQRLFWMEYPIISPFTFNPTRRFRLTPFALSWVNGDRMLLVFRGTVWREVRGFVVWVLGWLVCGCMGGLVCRCRSTGGIHIAKRRRQGFGQLTTVHTIQTPTKHAGMEPRLPLQLRAGPLARRHLRRRRARPRGVLRCF